MVDLKAGKGPGEDKSIAASKWEGWKESIVPLTASHAFMVHLTIRFEFVKEVGSDIDQPAHLLSAAISV